MSLSRQTGHRSAAILRGDRVDPIEDLVIAMVALAVADFKRGPDFQHYHTARRFLDRLGVIGPDGQLQRPCDRDYRALQPSEEHTMDDRHGRDGRTASLMVPMPGGARC
jgi:hypothetical protein